MYLLTIPFILKFQTNSRDSLMSRTNKIIRDSFTFIIVSCLLWSFYQHNYMYHDELIGMGYKKVGTLKYSKEQPPHIITLDFRDFDYNKRKNELVEVIIETDYQSRSLRPMFCNDAHFQELFIPNYTVWGGNHLLKTNNGYMVPKCLSKKRLKNVIRLPNKNFYLERSNSGMFIPELTLNGNVIAHGLMEHDHLKNLTKNVGLFINYQNALLDI